MTDLITEIDSSLKKLFPITRSITGLGNRLTLKILQEIIPLEIKEYPSGTSVYDWVIPDEWLINDAWIKSGDGNKLVDYKKNNIHLVSYSEPVNRKICFTELKEKLHCCDKFQDAIPYHTSYYNRDWGFCVNREQYNELEKTEGLLEVFIDSEFKSDGSLTVGEILIPGKTDKEILISTYICHPSLANDNLSGVVLTAFLAKELIGRNDLNYSYRIIFVPETIGAITYCSMNETVMKNIETGFVVTCVGGPGKFGYKQSHEPEHFINDIVEQIFLNEKIEYETYPFDIHGSDERQYSSQGFGINTVSITKDKYYEYEKYHTSLDNLDFISAENIFKSLSVYIKTINIIDKNVVYRNCFPHCELMLSKRDLYPKHGGSQNPSNNDRKELDLILWLLFLCDGKNDLYSIAKRLDVKIELLYRIAERIRDKNILELVNE